MYCEKDQSNWPELLPSVMMSFRVSLATEPISLSPFHMVFGKEMNLPVDTALIPKPTMSQDAKQYFEELLERLKMAKDIAISNMQLAQAKSKQYHDQKAKEPDFALHDRVLLKESHVPTGLSPKLFQRFEGPYYIVELGPNNTYKLRRCSDHKLIKSFINATRITHYKDPFIMRDIPDNPQQVEHVPEEPDEEPVQHADIEPTAEVNNDPNPDPKDDPQQINVPPSQPTHQNENKTGVMERSTQEPKDTHTSQQSGGIYFEVERLLKTRHVGNQKQYLVKWKGNYPNSWEPDHHITERPKREFLVHRTQRGRKKRRRKSQFYRR